MRYELWDFDTGNFINGYPSLEAALEIVRTAHQRDGDETLEGLTLLEVDPNGDSRMVARERELLELTKAGA